MIKQLFLIRSRGGHFANVTHIKLVQFALKTFTTRNMLNSIIMFSFTTYICMYGYERELDIDVHMQFVGMELQNCVASVQNTTYRGVGVQRQREPVRQMTGRMRGVYRHTYMYVVRVRKSQQRTSSYNANFSF